LKEKKPLLVVLAGPTAVGKTDLSIDIANRYSTEILSADSRQIYRQLHIGVAKPGKEKLKQVRHHFIDHIDITASYSAGQYEREAISTLDSLFSKRPIAIMTGGTGLYLKAVLEGFDEFPAVSREKWSRLYNEKGLVFLQESLKKLDPAYYAEADIGNPHRLIRALSVSEQSKVPYSQMRKREKVIRPFQALQIALCRPREELYERINQRVDQMIEMGLLDEVKGLLPHKSLQSLQSVGYQELFRYLEGEWSLEEAVDKIKQHSRNYAKRQMTWFRNQGNWHMMHPEMDRNRILKLIDEII
jgi:tRNA dimethylallyltransferase